ncbi:DJ-1/PfpI family protein [Candidatus Woesearchaeota archaeon]|nr:DJ-1/PfpI family protein [Candidatus Woesearchaeota archaeon]
MGQDKKILMVIAPEGFRDEEFLEPKKVFEGAGAEVTVASKGVKVAKGKLGATADVDMDISEASADDYDAVVFIGGPGAAVYFDDPVALNLAQKSYNSGKVTAAICIAPSILANAGVLDGKQATSFESESRNIEAKSAGYTGKPVTVDGKIVTANGPAAAKKFGEAIVKLLGDAE